MNTSHDKTGIVSQERMESESQEEIEKLYYKAVQDAKSGDLTKDAGQEPEPPGYCEEKFSRWAKGIDIYTLDKGAADFSTKQHEEIVKEFGDYRQKVAAKLSQELVFEGVPLNGQLRDIGSCIDGSKIGSVNEMDSLYVMQENTFTIEHSDKRGLYHVYLRNGSTRSEIQPRRIRDNLAGKYSELIFLLKMPDCLVHGGYKRSCEANQPHTKEENARPQLENTDYSGVRYNGPAVTSQFLTKDNTLLTWDVTPVVVLRDASEIQAGVRKSESMQAIITDNPEKMFPPTDVHLFPDVTVNLWRLSTAQMEAEVLGRMSKIAPFKEAFSSGKVLTTQLKIWHKGSNRYGEPDVHIVDDLDKYKAIKDSTGKKEAAKILNRKMRFAHIWIPADLKDLYYEDGKSDISINNAAVKHILLKAASRIKGAFAPVKNPVLVKKLLITAFQILGNDNSDSSEHAFLQGMQISHFSVAPGMASQKLILTRDIRQQCRTLLQETMADVRNPRFLFPIKYFLTFERIFLDFSNKIDTALVQYSLFGTP